MEDGNYVKWFSELDLDSRAKVGSKASSLAFLYKNKIPVLEGFVLTFEAVDKLFEIWDIKDKFVSMLNDLKSKDLEFDNFKEDIKRIILNEDFPEEILREIYDSYEVLGSNKYEIERGSALDILKSASEDCFVAVRSSPEIKTYSENSFLNIKGKAELSSSIKYAIISNYYDYDSLEKNNFEFFSSGVIVQKMIQSEKSGYVLSKTGEGNILIEAIWGLGLGLDLEEINKDSYVLSNDLKLLDLKVKEKNFAFVRDSSGKDKLVKLRPERSSFQVLTNYEFQRIGDLVLKSEQLFKKPIKLQFSVEGEDIFITNVFEADVSKIEKVESFPEEEIIQKKVEVVPLQTFTNSKIELLVDSVLERESLEKTNVKKAGWIKLDQIFVSSKKHRDYYLNYQLYKEYRELIESKLKEIVSAFDESFISINDILSNSYSELQGASYFKEENPLMGLHGIRYGLKNREMLDAEIWAIKNSLEGKEGGILVPFITNIKEFKEFKEILKARNFDKKVGVIVDNPSSIQLIKSFFEYGLDLIILDFDRIVESLLMVDLENEESPKYFDFNNSAIFSQIEYLIRVCKRNNCELKVKFSFLEKEVFELFIQKGVNTFLSNIISLGKIPSFLKPIEEEIIFGTDREPREYEVKKEREERNLPEEKNQEENEEISREAENSEDEEEEIVAGAEYSVENLLSKKENSEEEHEELKEEGEEFDTEVEEIFSEEEQSPEEKKDSVEIF